MIKKFRSKALKLAFSGDLSKINPAFAAKVALALAILDAAQSFEDIKNLADFHPLKGNREGEFSVTISGNWRITFTPAPEIEENPMTGKEELTFHITRVDFEDYH